MRSIIKCPYYYFNSAITDEFCDLIIATGKEKVQQDAIINSGGEEDTSYRRGKVSWLKDAWIEAMLGAYVERANKEANWNFIVLKSYMPLIMMIFYIYINFFTTF